MPLDHLVDTFNARFIAENHLEAPALSFDGQSVRGRFGNLTFTSDLKPVRLHGEPDRIIGHDTAPLVFTPANSLDTTRLLHGEDMPKIVSLDRLSRTVHMLNYLILDRPEGNLFLQVHPHHVLTVKRDHGAYFEDIIRQCGLPLRRIVIGLTLNPSYETQLPVLLERLKTYRDRGYSTSVTFGEHVGSDFVERFRSQFLHRFAPDYVRFQVGFFQRAYQDHGGGRRRTALLAAIRQVDTQVLIGDIRSASNLELIHALNPDYVQGPLLDQRTMQAEALLKVG